MQKPTIKSYTAWVLLTEAVGALSGWLSRNGIQAFSETAVQPPFSPPAIVFPIVWAALYGLMGISAARIAAAPNRGKALNVFFAQLIVNFFWSPLFFSAQAYGFAFLWLFLLWVLILKWVPVWVTPLMISRSIEYRSDDDFRTQRKWCSYEDVSPEGISSSVVVTGS